MNLEILLIATLVAVSCVIPGVFLLLRRMAMMSDAISHSILLGIVVGFFLAGSLTSPLPILGAVAASMLTVIFTELLYKTNLVKSDAAIGIVFPAMFSLGVILVTLGAGNIHLDIDAVLLGEIAFAPLDRMDVFGFSLPRSLVKMTLVLFVNLLLLLLFFKELKLTTFDPGLAASLGFSPAILNYGLMLVTSITAIMAFDSVGAVLVVALMIAPSATALLLTDHLARMILYAALLAVTSAAAGFFLARSLDASIAGTIAAVMGCTFFLAFLFAPKQGVVARAITRYKMRKDFHISMLLVHLLHHESSPGWEGEILEQHLTDHIDWTEDRASEVVDKALALGLIERRDGLLFLTSSGRDKAREIVER